MRMSELVDEFLARCATLFCRDRATPRSGPVIPTAVMTAAKDAAAARAIQQACMNEFFRVYTSDDVVGAELGGSLKNVLALAAGVLDGMGMGDTPRLP